VTRRVRSSVGPVARFISRRLAIGVLTIWAISVLSFTIIQLPPGDFVSNYVARLSQTGGIGTAEDVAKLRADLGLDRPAYVQYVHWAWNVLHGDFGRSLDLGRPVSELIGERLGLTLLVALGGLFFAWVFALPIGIYCASHRGSIADYLLTGIGMIGMAVPAFLLSLFAMYVAFRYFDVDLGQVQSPQYLDAPASLAKTLDLLRHLILPTLILGLGAMTRLFRILRANLLDEIDKPYVVTARAKGMSELALIVRYPTRIALNPFVSTIGLALPQVVSGSLIISLVMSLPTLGPLLLRALLAQDMFLAGAIMLVLAALTVVGMLISDLLLAWLDPRIRLQY
jgi:peptide/nickel transport system permease protein